ncbi:reverse transcriptase domain-containing protein [Tanacetum coccineum]
MRKFLSKYFPPSMVTKLRNEITKFRQDPNESLFEAWERYKLSIDRCPNHNMLLVTQIDTFYNGLTLRHQDTINAAAGGTFMQKTPEECYDLIESMTAHHNHWDTSATRDETSRTISSTTNTTESLKVVRQLELMNKNFQDMMKQIQSVKSVSPKCQTYGGPHSFTGCLAVGGYTQEASYATMVLLKKLPEKLGDPSKFLISCDFPKLVECLALADLGASINLMPLSVWRKLSLPELTPTRMTLELANRSIAYPVGVAEDVFVKVGKFHFPADFVVIDYDVDPRIPLILGMPFLRTARALIDVYSEELTLRFNDEAITFNVGDTSSYSYKYDNESVNRIDVIDVTCEEYAQEVLGFLDSSTSGNPTPSDPIIASSSSSFTLFKGGDFILEEIETFLHTPDTAKSVIAELKTVKGASNTHNLILDERFDDFSLKSPTEIVDNQGFPHHCFFLGLVDNDLIPIRIRESDRDIDSLFNGYYLDSSSDDEDANSVNGMDEDNMEEKNDEDADVDSTDDSEKEEDFDRKSLPSNGISKKTNSGKQLFLDTRGVRVSTQPQKNQKKKIKKTTILSQPIPSNSFNNDETVEISDSFSKINRCNTRNFSKPSVSMESPSNEVENTIILGKKVGFDMEGKDHEIASVIANGDNMVDQ